MAEGPEEIRRRVTRSENPTPDEVEELKQRAQSNDEVEATRAEVELTRVEMTETVDALQDKLDPETLKEQATDAARNAGSDFVEALKQNPVPVAIIGGLLGLAILGRLLSGGGKERRGGSETVVFDLRRGRIWADWAPRRRSR
ncbi:MAG: DUF3618 domain-containing protein [Actinomycetota bacterium]|nr:DUF3618 domain-containing protein [Actinomycetota bacterium]